MKKILICLSSFSVSNGIAAFILNQVKNIDKSNYKIDCFCVLNGKSDKNNLDYLKNYNIGIYESKNSNSINRFFVTYSQLNRILKQGYDIVHVNLVDFFALGCIVAAKKNKVSRIVYHVHNPMIDSNFMFLRKFVNSLCIKYSTNLCACSESAGLSVFGDNQFEIIRNLIDYSKFRFNEEKRKLIRKELNVSNSDILLGCVGRLIDQKNPFMVLDILEKLSKNGNYKFIWIGDGPLYNDFIVEISRRKLSEQFFLLGSKLNVNDYYCAMDIFLLPSLFEGFGIVFLEAQSSGLRCFASNKVPKSVKETDLIDFIDLEYDAFRWANDIKNSKPVNIKNRLKYNEILSRNSMYSINNKKASLNNYYSKILGELK